VARQGESNVEPDFKFPLWCKRDHTSAMLHSVDW